MAAVDFWRVIEAGNPRYHSQFKDLILRFAAKGGASDTEKHERAKSFGNVYEFYVYAALIGLYLGSPMQLTDEKTKYETFWKIEGWKSKGFDEIVRIIFQCLIGLSDIDLVELEEIDDDIKVKEKIQSLVKVLEQYANGGFQFIQARREEDPEFFEGDRGFVNLLAEVGASKLEKV